MKLPRKMDGNRRRQIHIALRARDGRGCRHCPRTTRLTIDHVVPLATGGLDELENMQLLCLQCHRKKDRPQSMAPPYTYKSKEEILKIADRMVRPWFKQKP